MDDETTMSLIDTIDQVLQTGVLPIATEHHLYRKMRSQDLTDAEVGAIEQLLEGLTSGTIQSVA